MACRERESKNEIAGFGVLKPPIPAISNAAASENRIQLNRLEASTNYPFDNRSGWSLISGHRLRECSPLRSSRRWKIVLSNIRVSALGQRRPRAYSVSSSLVTLVGVDNDLVRHEFPAIGLRQSLPRLQLVHSLTSCRHWSGMPRSRGHTRRALPDPPRARSRHVRSLLKHLVHAVHSTTERSTRSSPPPSAWSCSAARCGRAAGPGCRPCARAAVGG